VLLPICTVDRDLQFQNALSAILSTESGSVISESQETSAKASADIDVTLYPDIFSGISSKEASEDCDAHPVIEASEPETVYVRVKPFCLYSAAEAFIFSEKRNAEDDANIKEVSRIIDFFILISILPYLALSADSSVYHDH